MQPRIYVYLITFVDQPCWYWGWHKEKRYDEYYMGSPVTNKNYWDTYEPIKEIVEVFDYSEEGELKARELEKRFIESDLNNPFCLNENCGGIVSSRTLSEAMKKRWKDPDYKEKVMSLFSSSKFRSKMSTVVKEKWKEAEYRGKVSQALSKAQREKLKDPNYREWFDSLKDLALTEESRQKRLESLKRIGHQQGEKNSQAGTMWITDGSKGGNKKIKRGSEIPEGYRPGRVCK